MKPYLNLVVIVEPADQAEAAGDQQACPNILVAKVHPQQHRDGDRGEDEQAAHRRRAALGEVALRPILADRLALALLDPQPADEPGTKQQTDDQRRRARRARAEADIADEVEDAAGNANCCSDQVEQVRPPAIRCTSFASPTELDALTNIASPGWSMLRQRVRVASSTLLDEVDRAATRPERVRERTHFPALNQDQAIHASTDNTTGARPACRESLCAPSSRIGNGYRNPPVGLERSAPQGSSKVAAIEAGLALSSFRQSGAALDRPRPATAVARSPRPSRDPPRSASARPGKRNIGPGRFDRGQHG